jgi:hypothetical protein
MLKSAVEALDLHFPKVTTEQRAELGAAYRTLVKEKRWARADAR